uniref:BAH domain-containing protein n=1 Tax=Electrophorus electricus TaxID=8005 RepID=A0A4W4HIA2_ELEEL
MEGRDFSAPAHLLSERGALVHRAASRISSAGHSSVQHTGHFPPGKYYPPHLPVATHSGSGLMANSSASFMGTFLASSLGTPPSHTPHPSRPPSSPSSPPYRGGPHSSASQIWFPHSHEAPGYPRFSGSLAHTFLPISHLDHHANSGVLYGQHRFYDTQKENFYLRSLPSQPPLISANHSIPPMSRTGPGHPQGSCSRDTGSGMNLHKGLKETGMDRGVVSGTKDKDRPSNKPETKDRHPHNHHTQAHHPHHHPHHHPQHHPKPLSACLINGKMQNGDTGIGTGGGAVTKAPMVSCGGEGIGRVVGGVAALQAGHVGTGRCNKEAVSGEMRISEQPPPDCLERGQALHQSLPYSVPPPLAMGSATGGGHPGGFHCLQLHPSHPGGAREAKVTGPTFVPSVGHLGEKTGGPFQLANPECQAVGGGGSSAKDKVTEKANSGGGGHPGNWHRKQPDQQQPPPQKQHPYHCLSTMDPDIYRPALAQEPKTGHPLTHPNNVNPQPYRDCSHPGPPPNSSPLAGKTLAQQGSGGGGGSCSMQRDGQKVARIRHQQHGRAASDGPPVELGPTNGSQEMKRKMEMSPYGYGNSGQHHSQQQPVPAWAMRPHHGHPEEDQRKAYMEAVGGLVGGALGLQGDGGAMKNLLKYSNQQPLILSQKSPFGGLGSLKTGPNGASCALQAGKTALPSRKGLANEGERPDCGGRNREMGEAPHGEGEVRQPPVGIAVAVARQREPTCRPMDNHPSSRHGRVLSAMKGASRPVYPIDSPGEDERKRVSGEHLAHPCLGREDNKERAELARIHPSNSCHGDLTSHLMVPGGTSLQSAQLGDPSAHAHSTHHHWMPRTGSPSLWMTGHSYGISHSALHQNLPPGFSAAMPAPLQPVLPLPQDPSAQLVVLPTEPATHPATHHIDVMDQPGLWPPVYRARGPPSHIQHPAVYSRSQFLRQQELYALQQHQQLQHQQHTHIHTHTQNQVTHTQTRQHTHTHNTQMQKKPEEQNMELEDILSEPRTPKPAKSYAYGQSAQASSPPRASTAHLSPCCQSPCMRPHARSTPSTPCPAQSPAATAPRSPAISPAPSLLPKAMESQDKRTEGQPPQNYPQSMEPELREEPGGDMLQQEVEAGPVEAVGCCVSVEAEQVQAQASLHTCPPAEISAHKTAHCPIVHGEEQALEGDSTITCGAQASGVLPDRDNEGQSELESQGTQKLPDPEHPCISASPAALQQNASSKEDVEKMSKEPLADDHSQKPSAPPSLPCATPCPQPPVPSYWSLELLIAAAFCGDAPPPSPPPSTPPRGCSGTFYPSTHGMELLSELAELELQQNRHRVCPVKGSMDAIDGQELAMRVQLAELQRRYKEKQKELAKLQRKHDHQKEETPRSPVRRGPGRPRKRKSTPGLGLVTPPEPQKKVNLHCCATEDEEEEGSYHSDEIPAIKAPPSRELPSSSIIKDPSPSSVVKLEANQKARNKRERQELYGSRFPSITDGDVKVKRRAPSRPTPVTTAEPPGVRRRPGRPRLQEKPWLGCYHKPAGLLPFPTSSERLRRATRKSSMLRRTVGKVSTQPHTYIRGAALIPWQPVKRSKGRAVSRLLESFAENDGFQLGEDSSFSDEEEDSNSSSPPPNCVLTKELLVDGLKVLISKEDELLYAARVRALDVPDLYSIVIDGERGNRPRIYSLEQLLQEAVLDVRPETEAVLTEATRVCAYWSERSRCLYPGYVRRGGTSDEGKPGTVMVEFDDGDRGRISLHNIRLLPPGYQVHCEFLTLLVSCHERRSSHIDKPSEKPASPEEAKAQEKPKGSGLKRLISDGVTKSPASPLAWPSLAERKRVPISLFQFNGLSSKKASRNREVDIFPHAPVSMTTPAKGIFSSSSFEVDSFSSIANGYSSFCGHAAGTPAGGRSSPYGQRKRSADSDTTQARKNEFLVKLDHEGVTSPKNKSSKALQLLGGSGFGSRVLPGVPPRPEVYTHPALLVKDNRKGDSSRAELLPVQRKQSPSLRMSECGELGLSCHRDCHSSYSDMDEEEEEEEERRRGGAGHFLSRLSVSSSSSGSSSTSSSGSISSSSLCSSDNDSSYSSEDEENSTLVLQSCLTPHHSLLQSPKAPTTPQHSFVAKAVAVSNAKGGIAVAISNTKGGNRKECPSSPSKPSRDLAKRQRLALEQGKPKLSPFLPARQLWRWCGTPTQRRGLKGKARKLFYRAIVRGRDTLCVGDCAVFLAAGRAHLPYIGRIESFWESWSCTMVVKVKWFYHPEETKQGKRHHEGKHALYQSCHEDENDVQTISHKCQVVSREEYEHLRRHRNPGSSLQDLYYLAGTYDPTSGQLLTADGVSILC